MGLLQPNFSLKALSHLKLLSKVQHFRISSEPPTSIATFVKWSIYRCKLVFFSWVIPLSVAILVVYLFQAVKQVVKLSHKSDHESVLPSCRDLNQIIVDPIRVSANILHFAVSSV